MAQILHLLKLNSRGDACVLFQTYLQKKKNHHLDDTMNLVIL